MQIRTVKELKSPARDLPEGVILTVGESVSESVASDLLRDGHAVECKEADKPGATHSKPKNQKRGEG